MRAKSGEISSRLLDSRILDENDVAVYYGSWVYVAVHILSALPDCRTSSDIASRLNLPLARVEETLRWLIERGIVSKGKDGLTVGTRAMHVGRDSPHVAKHHMNWRLKAIERLDPPGDQDLHYTSLLGVSVDCMEAIRSRLLSLLSEIDPLVEKSLEKEFVLFQFDLMRL